MAKEKKASALATVLAFEKKLVPSDGYMYSTKWENREQAAPIALTEKAVRGTVSNRLDSVKLTAEIQKPNPQIVDSAALHPEDDTLKLQFTLKVLPDAWVPSACNSEAHYAGILAMGESYVKENGFTELARRYAANLANGRFLWRNRIGAEDIEIVVSDEADQKTWTFHAYDFRMRDFDETDEAVGDLAGYLADALSGKRNSLLLTVTAYVRMGKGQEVYPSEELIFNKEHSEVSKGSKSKVLYAVNGIAAMHSQKIGNALRTIDTWYPGFDESNFGPIAIEVYGAVTTLGRAYRNPITGKDFYTLFDAWSMGKAPKRIEDRHYVMAVLVRGGVFGVSGKD